MFIVSCCELLVPFVSDRPLIIIIFTLLCSGDYVTVLRCVTAVWIQFQYFYCLCRF